MAMQALQLPGPGKVERSQCVVRVQFRENSGPSTVKPGELLITCDSAAPRETGGIWRVQQPDSSLAFPSRPKRPTDRQAVKTAGLAETSK